MLLPFSRLSCGWFNHSGWSRGSQLSLTDSHTHSRRGLTCSVGPSAQLCAAQQRRWSQEHQQCGPVCRKSRAQSIGHVWGARQRWRGLRCSDSLSVVCGRFYAL